MLRRRLDRWDTGGGGGWTARTQEAGTQAALACARGRDLGSGEGWRWGLGTPAAEAAQSVEAAGVLGSWRAPAAVPPGLVADWRLGRGGGVLVVDSGGWGGGLLRLGWGWDGDGIEMQKP